MSQLSSNLLLTTDELAGVLKVPRSTLYHWRATGKGPRAKKIGRYLRYEASEVQKWLDAQTYAA